MNVLFLSAWFPWPPDNGSKLRIYHLLKSLSERHRITLIAAAGEGQAGQRVPPVLASLCHRIEAVAWQPQPVSGMRRWLSFLHARPDWVVLGPSAQMQQAIARAVRGNDYDLAVASELGTGIYAQELGELPKLLEDLELGAYRSAFDPDHSFLRRWRGRAFWWKLCRAVVTMLEGFDACTVVSVVEGELVREVASGFGPVEVIPNCIDYGSYAEIHVVPEAHSLIFSGSLRFRANYEGMVWFLQEVFPLIRRRTPEVRLCITGPQVQLPVPLDVAGGQVIQTGYVEDVRPLIARSWISVVPLLTGGGTRLKILEAMALGTPVVSTSKGVEGLDVVHEEHALVADDPVHFAEQVIRLLGDVRLRERLAASGRLLVAERYDWEQAGARFNGLCEQVAGSG